MAVGVVGKFELVGEGLPPDVACTAYRVDDAVSELFLVEVDWDTAEPDFDPTTLLGNSYIVDCADDSDYDNRDWHGICAQAEFRSFDGERYRFRMELRPTLAALAFRRGSKIYQDMSPVDVVKDVLANAGIENAEWRLETDYPPREFIVQYRETELAFVSRLLENEGIFFFSEQKRGEHKIVLGDSVGAYNVDAPVTASYRADDEGAIPITKLERTKRLGVIATTLRDYDFASPAVPAEASQTATDAYPLTNYQYPGGFFNKTDGERVALARMRELRCGCDVLRGALGTTQLSVGSQLTTTGARQLDTNGDFLVTRLTMSATQAQHGTAEPEPAQVSFEAIPVEIAFGPARVTPTPRIHGLQTATVTGPQTDDQAIHVDKYGRIKVRFHWDRVGQYDDASSCWLRVVQVSMGGSMVLPRVGWEVSVSFRDGDPDQPFATGRVYNPLTAPPYGLPGAQASGALKSMSSPGGGGHNELNMADSGGAQGFSIHAQKDLNITIGNDKTETIDVDETHSVTVNMQTQIGANTLLAVAGNQTVNVGAVDSKNVTGDREVLIGGNLTDNSTANYVDKVAGDCSETVGGNKTVISNTVINEITGDMTRTVSAVMLSASVASISDSIAGDCNESVGAAKIDLCKGESSEAVTGNKNLTSTAAEIHLVKGAYGSSGDAAVTQLVGGLHYSDISGDYSVTAPMITMVGAIGDFKAGGTNLKLGGGPVVAKGKKITIKGALSIKLSGGMKIGK